MDGSVGYYQCACTTIHFFFFYLFCLSMKNIFYFCFCLKSICFILSNEKTKKQFVLEMVHLCLVYAEQGPVVVISGSVRY